MNIRDANIRTIEEIKYFFELAVQHKNVFFSSENVFTRNRKLPFKKLALMIINFNKRSLSVEIEDFFNAIGKPEQCCTKGAFCKQRMHLSYLFFKTLNQVLVESFHRYYREYIKRWNGYRIMAVDGSTEYLLNQPEVVEFFGVQKNQCVSIPMARVMNRFDVLNGISVSSELLPISISEQTVAAYWVDQLEEDTIHLYDRGFASFALFYLHIRGCEQEKYFVARCKDTFNNEIKDFMRSKKRSKVIKLRVTKSAKEFLYQRGYILKDDATIKVRFIKIKLASGETEVIATNLMDREKFPCSIFKEMYAMRWGIESEYGAWKNIYQLEQFSGRKVESILQDFYATVFISNLHQMFMKEGEEKVNEINQKRKLNYKINRNVTCGLLKNRVVELFLSKQPNDIIENLKNLFCKYIEPVRTGRHYVRKLKNKRLKGKYQTLTNYKRAV